MINSLQGRIEQLENELASMQCPRNTAPPGPSKKQPSILKSKANNNACLDQAGTSSNTARNATLHPTLDNNNPFYVYANQYQYWQQSSNHNPVPTDPRACNHGSNNWQEVINNHRQPYNHSTTEFIPTPPSNHSQQRLPVSKWPISKYDGDDQGLKLNEFLEIKQALSVAEHVSETELFESAVHLFSGPALKWYMTMRSTGRLLNWQDLVLELRRSFMHPDLDALIKMKVYQRRQQRNETFLEFYHEMERLFRTMTKQLPDYEKVQILLQCFRTSTSVELSDFMKRENCSVYGAVRTRGHIN
ncbi:uncharacterized protein LOC131691218 [Topomyia yanbarensis]|uniref:uncharacterized protein LOC131691218 n=1 Tax=Topomyia yanbarensis TaxID=2498891 RepID=UPI00273BAA7E|nr:uncharacterized protein LOC131691218 [Topomyia yanbarensis]XP_058833432.1 uncharacterized protein LOC131691218 [Topomyia yanbarensis]